MSQEEVVDYEEFENSDDETEFENNKKNIDEEVDESIGITLELGDIIEILAPTHSDIHETSFYIDYIDENQIELIHIANLKRHQLEMDESGGFTDESITSIILHSRSKESGYARQHKLLVKTWVNIHFGGEFPLIITGEITDLIEDQIEIMTYPELKTIYIDFAYKGIPKTLPLEKIVIREKPANLKKINSLKELQGDLEQDLEAIEEDISIEYLDNGEAIIHLGNNDEPIPDIQETLHDIYRKNQGIIIGETLEEVTQLVEVTESQKRYGLETQLNSMIDEFLSTIPNYQRTNSVMDKIHRLVERYKELRELFSKFDENENVRGYKTRDPTYKPLVQKIQDLDTKLKWILPVVSFKKKIYPEEEDQIHEAEDLFIFDNSSGQEIMDEVNLQKSTYYENKSAAGVNRFYNMYESINDYGKSFIEPTDDKDFLLNDHVKTNLEAIVDNLDDHYSSALHDLHIVRRRYVMQTYNLGLSKFETVFRGDDKNMTSNSVWRRCSEGGKRVLKRVPMTNPDKIAIKSLIVFPKSVVQYSKLFLPSTNILDRVNLHHAELFYFRLLSLSNKVSKYEDTKPGMIQYIVDNIEKEIEYEDTELGFLSKTTEYVLADEFMNDPNKFEQFLKTIFPKTKVLIKIIEKHLRNKLSFIEVVDALEPFLLYASDITYKQYANEIRYFIKTKIEEVKRETNKKSLVFRAYKNTKYKIERDILSMLRIFLEKKDTLDLFLKSYQFKEKDDVQKSSSSYEMIRHIMEADNGRLFSILLSSIMISLRTPNNLATLVNDDMGSSAEIKADDCNKRRLVKKYTSIEALQKDNHTEDVFFDKEFDKTPYDIMQKYKDDQKKMLNEKFVKFLEENLVQKHDCPREKAAELTKTLIEGKRRVESGDYAIVQIVPKLSKHIDEDELSKKEKDEINTEGEARMRVLYYHRRGTTWVEDKEIDEEAFLTDDLLICNLSKKCVKNVDDDTCESTKQATQRLMGQARSRANKEFDRRYEISKEDLQKSLEHEIKKQLRFLSRWNIIRDIQRNKVNLLEYDIGLTSQLEEIVESPYLKLRDMILAQDDFSKKQLDIVNFAGKFTREPLFTEEANEDVHWKYCKETNTKLLPGFFLILAQEFVLGSGGDYSERLAQVCVSHGEKHGDTIWDKYSGYSIRKDEFSMEEGYTDSGFKVKTNDVLEIDQLENLKLLESKDKVFESKESEMIYKVFLSLCKNIDVPIDEIEGTVLRISMDLVKNRSIISSEDAYSKRAKKLKETKGTSLPPYGIYCNEMIIIITASVLLASIQTLTTLKTNKTFPGCIRSFTGYPFGGIEDLTSIDYISCVLEKMRNPSTEPWNSIHKIKREGLKIRMKTVIEQFIVTNMDIEIMIQEKREYLSLNPSVVPTQHNMKRWTQFLPPVVTIDVIKHLQPVNSQFKQDFIELMKKGDKNQREDFNVFKSKIMYYSYAMLQAIQEIIKMKTVLLKTMSNVPFLQNACCNEKEANPMTYFKEEDESIGQYIKIVESLAANIDYVNQVSKAGLMFDPRNSKLRIRDIGSREVNEQNIYAAMIHYCGLDRYGFIDSTFHAFFTELPREYNKKSSLDEKIVLLKNEGKRFTETDLHHLMRIVNKQNIVGKYKKQKYSFVEILKDLLQNFDNADSRVVEEQLRIKLRDCLNEYNPSKMFAIDEEEPNKSLETLKNYLSRVNDNMYGEIMTFLNEFGNLKKKDFLRIRDFLSNTKLDCKDEERKYSIQSWALDCDDSEYYDNGLYTVFNFIKNSIYDITHVFPEMILNNITYTEIPKHWGLGERDQEFIEEKVENYTNSLNEFKGDINITRLLEEIKLKNVDLYLFISNLPIHTPIVKNGTTFYSIFDKKTCYQLIMYIFYSVLMEYIELANDEDMLQMNVYEMKMERRAIIRERKDKFTSVSSGHDSLDEELYEGDEDMNEVQINVGQKEELKKRIASLLTIFINIIQKNKTMADMSYKNIMEKVRDSKKREKDMIIRRLDKLTKEERRVENMMKELKLGKWNVGEQHGLFKYDITTQEREWEEQKEQGVLDIEIQYDIEVSELEQMVNQVSVEEMDFDDERRAEIEMANEGLDFTGLTEDYNDGNGGYGMYDKDDEDFPED